MHALLMSLVVTANPVFIHIELQDALRFPSGKESPPADPLTIYVKAPAAWAAKGGISEAGKTAVLAKMYGGPNWMNGNSDGSTYVVKRFTAKVLPKAPDSKETKSTWWYDVLPNGALEKRGPGFGEPPAEKQPGSFIDHAEKGSVFKRGPKASDAKALRAWLDQQTLEVKLPVTLSRGQVGFTSKGAKVGSLELRCEDAALGISLSDRAEQQCKGAATCALMLRGKWKPHATDPSFAVLEVVGPVPANELGEYAWVNEPN